MKYRSKTEIAAQILQAAVVGGISKSKIMYKAFLSYEQLREYLDVLLANGLLDHDERTNTYKTTEKGARFLKIYEQLLEMWQKEEKNSNSND